jgi:hypothetical protein
MRQSARATDPEETGVSPPAAPSRRTNPDRVFSPPSPGLEHTWSHERSLFTAPWSAAPSHAADPATLPETRGAARSPVTSRNPSHNAAGSAGFPGSRTDGYYRGCLLAIKGLARRNANRALLKTMRARYSFIWLQRIFRSRVRLQPDIPIPSGFSLTYDGAFQVGERPGDGSRWACLAW